MLLHSNIIYTVELNKGHLGTQAAVPYSEVVPYWEVRDKTVILCTFMMYKTHYGVIKVGGILRCRLWMQTNALSRQVALLAEPKNSTMSTNGGFFVHTMKHCYATALYTTALSITHVCISLPHA